MKNKDFQEKFNKNNRLANDSIAQVMNLKVSREQRREDDRFSKCNIKCSICNFIITDARDSHNPMPLNDSRYCDGKDKILTLNPDPNDPRQVNSFSF
jgi:hypothetical protein